MKGVPMKLEDELRAALRREPAPADFAAGVLRKTRPAPLFSPVTWAVAAAIAVGAIIPSAYQSWQHERTLEARDQLVLALSITKAQLDHTKAMLQNKRQRQ
jgi:hypothetical protein